MESGLQKSCVIKDSKNDRQFLTPGLIPSDCSVWLKVAKCIYDELYKSSHSARYPFTNETPSQKRLLSL
jgi:hypothetical protein